MDREGLRITKTGKLINREWFYDEELDIGEYRDNDVTAFAYRYLFDECRLDPDVSLRSIFFLVKKHEEIFDKIFGCWTKEY